MDDDKDKNVIEQLVDKVNDFVETIANTASDALDDAIEPASVKPNRQPMPSYEFPAPDSTVTPVSIRTKKRATKKINQDLKTIREEIRQKSSREVVEQKTENNCHKKW
jgi:hypothetical protein